MHRSTAERSRRERGNESKEKKGYFYPFISLSMASAQGLEEENGTQTLVRRERAFGILYTPSFRFASPIFRIADSKHVPLVKTKGCFRDRCWLLLFFSFAIRPRSLRKMVGWEEGGVFLIKSAYDAGRSLCWSRPYRPPIRPGRTAVSSWKAFLRDKNKTGSKGYGVSTRKVRLW